MIARNADFNLVYRRPSVCEVIERVPGRALVERLPTKARRYSRLKSALLQ